MGQLANVMCAKIAAPTKKVLPWLGMILMFVTLMLNRKEWNYVPLSPNPHRIANYSTLKHTLLLPPGVRLKAEPVQKVPVEGVLYQQLQMSTSLREVAEAKPVSGSMVIPHALNATRKAHLMSLVIKVQRLLEEHRVTWMMYYGTLLGSFINHDLLPWDDDFDCLIEQRGIDLIKAMHKNDILQKQYGLEYCFLNYTGTVHKLFFASMPKIPGEMFSWPYIDLIVFVSRGSYVKNLDSFRFWHRFWLPQNLVFPLHERPFGSMWLPAPRDPWAMLSQTYRQNGHFRCETRDWDHITNTRPKVRNFTTCEHLRRDYPFAWRQPYGNGTLETLWIDRYPLYTVLLENEPFYETSNPYHWHFLTHA